MDSLISRIPELQKTICDEIESFSVVGYQAFESGKKIQNCFVVVNLYLKHIFCISNVYQPFESEPVTVFNLELYLFANILIQLIKAMFRSTSQLFSLILLNLVI